MIAKTNEEGLSAPRGEDAEQNKDVWLTAIADSHATVTSARNHFEEALLARGKLVSRAVREGKLSASAIGGHVDVSHVTVLRWVAAADKR